MAINASFKSNNPVERALSNLAHSNFFIEDRECYSIEGFYQGIKRSGEDIQNHIFKTFGIYAKNYSKPTKHVYFNGRKYKAGSKEHHELIFQAQLAKYTQCKTAKTSLLLTGKSQIVHHVGSDSILYPGKVYCKHLTTIRSILQKEK